MRDGEREGGAASETHTPAAFRRRLVSAIILLPVTIVAISLGGPILAGLAILLAGLMSFEWTRQIAPRASLPMLLVYLVFLAGAILLCSANQSQLAGAVLVGGAVAADLSGRILKIGRHQALAGFGVLYFGLPGFAVVDLRMIEPGGVYLVLWLCCSVWATDTGAYLIGKPFGRRPLWPEISPSKTLEGLIGGAAAAALVGSLFVPVLPFGSILFTALLSVLIALVAQAGDLLESGFKRRFGVKDMSGLVPGHGGVLDRLDSLILVLAIAGVVGSLWPAP